MKSFFNLLVIFLTISMASCSSDDEASPLPMPMPDPVNQAPSSFDLTHLPNASTEASLTPTLIWNQATDPDGDEVSYQLFLDTIPAPTTLLQDNLSTSYHILTEKLSLNTNYYWQVNARDGKNGQTKSGSVFGFTTRNINAGSPLNQTSAYTPTTEHQVLVYNNQLWLLGGANHAGRSSEVWVSSDGSNWRLANPIAAFGEISNHSAIVFKNKMWVLGGYKDFLNSDEIWSSTDGINWEPEGNLPYANAHHKVLVFNNKLWMLGGNGGTEIWSSADGLNWNLETNSPAFGSVYKHTAAVFKDKMWVIGGRTPGGLSNKVFFSSNGLNWVEAGTPIFNARANHASVVYDNKLWVLGGSGHGLPAGYGLNDVWVSDDGYTWTQVYAAANFEGRRYFAATVFNDALMLFGGIGNTGAYLNDVWVLD